MVISQLSDSFFILLDCAVEFAIGSGSIIHSTSLNSFFLTIIEHFELMQLLLRCFIVLSNKFIDFSFFLVNLTLKLLFSGPEFIFLSLISGLISMFHCFQSCFCPFFLINCFVQLLSQTLIFLFSLTIFEFMFEFTFIQLLLHDLEFICHSISDIIMLLLKHLPIFYVLVFNFILPLLEFFATNDRLTILSLQTL